MPETKTPQKTAIHLRKSYRSLPSGDRIPAANTVEGSFQRATGLTTPFLPAGISSLPANWISIALLLGVRQSAREPGQRTHHPEKKKPIRQSERFILRISLAPPKPAESFVVAQRHFLSSGPLR